ncbi:MAG: hypothetical protein ACTHKG_05420 [Nocardioides sp.]
MTKFARRLLVGVTTIVVAALAAALLWSSPSAAAPQRLLVSNDGESWSQNLTTPLFEELGPFVPQDDVTDRFYVKNNSNQPARATFRVSKDSDLNDFERNLSFSYTVGTTGTDEPVIVGKQNKCKAYVTGPTIKPGESQPINVNLQFADVQGQVAMDQTANVDMVVTLSQVTPKGMVDICGAQARAEPSTECKSPNAAVVTLVGQARCPVVAGVEAFADTSGAQTGTANRAAALGSTGAPRSLSTLLPLSLAMLAAGAALLAVRRRRESD